MGNAVWEYRVIPIASEASEDEAEVLEAQLDELGSECWELVALDTSGRRTLYVFKRRVTAGIDEEGDEEYEGDEVYDDEYDEDGTIRINPPSGRR
jgi:hypothetical protein